ncbi:RNA-binding S4 domain-containing protein [Rhodoligotrophos defluvii]|uniref:RNA-binding S4 domain-containing protein n=1 Tax=Rhodoligotrophos defluvii TaxID=2561934 RepID=UPI0010C9D6BD|nr:RNA-binding S4 domain-containing protein [Rhodoligotrophos defluvii]
MTDPGQRIDKWLVYARLVKTRSLAVELLEHGRVRVNRERMRKPSHVISPGDILTLSLPGRVRVLRVLRCGERRGPAREAQTLYQELTLQAEDGISPLPFSNRE